MGLELMAEMSAISNATPRISKSFFTVLPLEGSVEAIDESAWHSASSFAMDIINIASPRIPWRGNIPVNRIRNPGRQCVGNPTPVFNRLVWMRLS
jgi:hypothetical protein